MPQAKCLRLQYQAGDFELCQGIKGWQHGKMVGGKWFRNRGFGWGESITPSKLILHTRISNKNHEIWIDFFFKRHLGKLFEGTRRLIEHTMPKEVRVQPRTSARGTKYFTVHFGDLQMWLDRIRSLPQEEAEVIRKGAKKKSGASKKKKVVA